MIKKVLKKFPFIEKIKKARKIYKFKMIKIALSSTFFTKIYYIINNDFDREMRAVLHGKFTHLKTQNEMGGNSYFLKRSTHRLEKGLLMKEKKKVFALDYIQDTVKAYKDLSMLGKLGAEDAKWSADVLNSYFMNTDSHPVINKAKKEFYSIYFPNSIKNQKTQYIPYTRDKNVYHQLPSLESFKQLSEYRRSVRWFENKNVEREKIDQAVHIAGKSPSACNRQPYKFRIIDQRDFGKKIINSAMGTTGYADNVPVVVAVVGELEAYSEEQDRHLIYIDASLAAMSFVYGLEIQGISSCIINWPDISKRETKISNLLDLEPQQRVIMLIGIGYADLGEKVAYSSKKPIDTIRKYN